MHSRIFIVRTPVGATAENGGTLVLAADDVRIGHALELIGYPEQADSVGGPLTARKEFLLAAFAPGAWVTCEETTQEAIDKANAEAGKPKLITPSVSDINKHGKGH